jgi:hypothetical protein
LKKTLMILTSPALALAFFALPLGARPADGEPQIESRLKKK